MTNRLFGFNLFKLGNSAGESATVASRSRTAVDGVYSLDTFNVEQRYASDTDVTTEPVKAGTASAYDLDVFNVRSAA